jgi:hypothetical protein
MKVMVKTASKDLRFKVQGKMQDSETYRPVNLDHNVTVKLNEGTLVLAVSVANKKATKDNLKP